MQREGERTFVPSVFVSAVLFKKATGTFASCCKTEHPDLNKNDCAGIAMLTGIHILCLQISFEGEAVDGGFAIDDITFYNGPCQSESVPGPNLPDSCIRNAALRPNKSDKCCHFHLLLEPMTPLIPDQAVRR